jgi:hypothetical protein
VQAVVAAGGLQAAVALMGAGSQCSEIPGLGQLPPHVYAARVVMLLVIRGMQHALAAVEAGAVEPYVKALKPLTEAKHEVPIFTTNLIQGLATMLHATQLLAAEGGYHYFEPTLCRQAIAAGLMPELLRHLQLRCPLGQVAVLALIRPLALSILSVPAGTEEQGMDKDEASLLLVLETMGPAVGQIARLLQQQGALDPRAAPWALLALVNLALADARLAAAARAAGAQAAAAAWRAAAASAGMEARVSEADRLLSILGEEEPRLRHEFVVVPKWQFSHEERHPVPEAVVQRQEEQMLAAQRQGTCAACGASSKQGGGALLQCSRCSGAAYCSPACQKAHWRKHKPKCRDPQKHAVAPEARIIPWVQLGQ